MKAQDFNYQKHLNFDLSTGLTTFRNTRLVIFDSDAIGLLRQNAIARLGFHEARALFLQFGFRNGYSDFMQLKVNYDFDSEIDLLEAGPILHTWEGIVRAEPLELAYNRETGAFFFNGIWKNSYEAEQHLMFNDTAREPVCWSLMGYASGYSTAFFGSPLLAIERTCVGMGDERCEWVIQPPADWGEQAAPYLAAYEPLFKEVGHG